MPKKKEKKGKSSVIITTASEPCKKQPWQFKTNKVQMKKPTIFSLFSLTLAALKNPQNPLSKTYILNSSKKFLSFLLAKSSSSSSSSSSSASSSSDSRITIILSLLPSLLNLTHNEIVCTAVQIVGAASLVSIKMNEKIALDKAILKGLVVNVLRSEKIIVKKAVCNAVLDISITSFGCQRLLDASALNYLMLGFLQVQHSTSTSLCMKVMKYDHGFLLGVENYQDDFLLLLLKAIVTFTNTCNYEQLKNIPRRLKEAIILYMREIWSKVHEQLSASKNFNFFEGNCYYASNLMGPNLAESIFRLSMDASVLTYSIPSETIIRQIFGHSPSSFKSFIMGHWESTPFLIRSQPKDSGACLPFSSFMQSLTCEEALPYFLSSILRGMVSCFPVALNEIHILNFLSDVRGKLGFPMIYQQDIRVVRTNVHSKCQEHYFKENLSHGIEALRSFSADDILRCMAAYEEGFTVALRGMEFRINSISEITREMASIFGQPSVGANLYVTPPNSQGLSCHYDDHCVFVCQLYGCKQWSVSPEPVVKLPRLYECREVPESTLVESREVFLKQGDVLYLPRGFAHKANTATDLGASNKAHNSSVHLTLAIELEPPFEWEGFAHIALYQWGYDIGSNTLPCDTSRILFAFSVNILHVSMFLISNNEAVFRKACLVASSSLTFETNYWLDNNQRDTFDLVIDKINELSNFIDSINFLQTAIQRDDDPFSWLRWLEHLSREESFIQDVSNFTLDGIKKNLAYICQHKDEAEATFVLVKSKFCNEVRFDYVKESFLRLYAKYKEARIQYMNGMLSLHC